MSTDIQPATSTDIQPAIVHSGHPKAEVLEVTVYAHSALFYWWPLWVAGYVMALLTWLHHEQVVIGARPEWFHPSRNPGVIYTLLLLLLILVTSARIKGMRAALIIATLAFFALLFAHLNWWEAILGWIGDQSISMSLGFYLFSSSLLCVAWFISVFLVDHLSFWRFRPGQVTHEYLGGIVDKSYDTDNMTILKRQDDIFRHWVIGLGSGDLNMQTMGGRGVEMNVPNVLFVIGKISRIQRLIATKPDLPEQA
ncbi:MAG: hypothetical protein ACLQNE_44840 [Thermoguttaceae bacterium]|jgi:hypothetical protein